MDSFATDPLVIENLYAIENLYTTMKRLMKKTLMICQADKVVCLLPVSDGVYAVDPGLAIGINEWREPIKLDGAMQLIQDGAINGTIQSDAISDFEKAQAAGGNFICVRAKVDELDENDRPVNTIDVGFVYIFVKRYGQSFNEDDLRLLEMLADQAAVVIQNNRKFRTVLEENVQLKEQLAQKNLQLAQKDTEIARLRKVIDISGINRSG